MCCTCKEVELDFQMAFWTDNLRELKKTKKMQRNSKALDPEAMYNDSEFQNSDFRNIHLIRKTEIPFTLLLIYQDYVYKKNPPKKKKERPHVLWDKKSLDFKLEDLAESPNYSATDPSKKQENEKSPRKPGFSKERNLFEIEYPKEAPRFVKEQWINERLNPQEAPKDKPQNQKAQVPNDSAEKVFEKIDHENKSTPQKSVIPFEETSLSWGTYKIEKPKAKEHNGSLGIFDLIDKPEKKKSPKVNQNHHIKPRRRKEKNGQIHKHGDGQACPFHSHGEEARKGGVPKGLFRIPRSKSMRKDDQKEGEQVKTASGKNFRIRRSISKDKDEHRQLPPIEKPKVIGARSWRENKIKPLPAWKIVDIEKTIEETQERDVFFGGNTLKGRGEPSISGLQSAQVNNFLSQISNGHGSLNSSMMRKSKVSGNESLDRTQMTQKTQVKQINDHWKGIMF